MRSSNKTYTITEYGGFARGQQPVGNCQPLDIPTFDALETFILANHAQDETSADDLLSLSVRRGVKVITARNYVGAIAMKKGATIEILPKICGGGNEQARRILLEMLKTLKDVPFKDFHLSNLKTAPMRLFEIFISMFAAEATTLVKQGLKSSYTPVEANERFFRGKLNVPQDIRHNYANRERFYVQYDEWGADCPENRLIKVTLRLLHKQSGDGRNRLSLSRLLSFFDGVESSTDYEADFSRCVGGRGMSHYEKALSWCRVFLRGNSFTAFAGSEVAVALLFPMAKIFESYVAAKLRALPGISLKTQDTGYSLFDRPKAFGLRPDIVLAKDGETVVMDTKWKLLSASARNYGISQSDMYQMYAYGKKYGAGKTVLLYPQPENLRGTDISFHSDDGVGVTAAFIDLLQPDASIRALL